MRFAQVVEHHLAAGDVLEHRVGVDEIEAVVGEELKAVARAVMRMRVGRVAQTLARQPDHFIGYVHAVDLREVPAHGAHQAARTATDFERRASAREARQLRFQVANDVGASREKLFLVLLAAAEGDVVVGVFAGARVPVGAHPRQGLGVHLEVVFGEIRNEYLRGVHHALFYSFMPLSFRQVRAAPITDFEATAPEGSIIGLIGEDGSGKTRLLRLAAGIDQPQSGTVERPESGRLLGPLDALESRAGATTPD